MYGCCILLCVAGSKVYPDICFWEGDMKRMWMKFPHPPWMYSAAVSRLRPCVRNRNVSEGSPESPEIQIRCFKHMWSRWEMYQVCVCDYVWTSLKNQDCLQCSPVCVCFYRSHMYVLSVILDMHFFSQSAGLNRKSIYTYLSLYIYIYIYMYTYIYPYICV